MSFSGNLLFHAYKEWRRFQALKLESRSIVFYAENAASMVHFEPIITELIETQHREICYLTSSINDPILNTKNEKIKAFYIGNGTIRTILFLSLKADVLVMDMPDFETFQIKRSRAYPVHYVYVFHSIASTHLNYRKGAFDHFDTIFCVGPYHVKEIRETEAVYGLKAKNLIEHGYGRLDNLLMTRPQKAETDVLGINGKKRVLVAPSWGVNGLLETRGGEITRILLEAGYHVTVRPHPETTRRCPKLMEELKDSFRQNSDFVLETDVSSQESLHSSHCLVSAWGGMAFEYAFSLERPVIFIDVPKKMNNPDYKDIFCIPLEISIRSEIGEIVSPHDLGEVPAKIERLYDKIESFREHIRQVRSKTISNIGKSGAVGAACITQIVDEGKGHFNKNYVLNREEKCESILS